MDEVDIPEYFICPISLQIMKDPVITVTVITYDRESIEQWVITDDSSPMCPVTKQPLPRTTEFTPNHTLRRLIQSWCIASANANAKAKIHQIQTPKSPINKYLVFKLLRDVNSDNKMLQAKALEKLDELACENERNQRCMAEAGVPKAMILFILKQFNERKVIGIDEAFEILILTLNIPTTELIEENFDFVQSILWALNSVMENDTSKNHALIILKKIIEVASYKFMERLTLDFFKEMVNILRNNKDTQVAKSVLHVLIGTCPSGINRTKIVESGAVFELIELELRSPDKRTTELIFCLLSHACCCADGRQKLLEHAGGIAVVAKRVLRISAACDDHALSVLESIARFSATRDVVSEMLRVSAVSKLCMVLQADCAANLKNKARGILRLHYGVWMDSPCIQVYLLTRYY